MQTDCTLQSLCLPELGTAQLQLVSFLYFKFLRTLKTIHFGNMQKYTEHFWLTETNFWPNFFWTKEFWDTASFETHIFLLDTKVFWTWNFSDSTFFLPDFYWTQHFYKIFWTHIFWTIIFSSNILLEKRLIMTQNLEES